MSESTSLPGDSDAPPPPEIEGEMIREEKEETVYATLIGLVHEVKKIQTKSGGNMLLATLESA
jgi:hypothetical protein